MEIIKIIERGPFRVGENPETGEIYVESEDFTYDARLHISGDFESPSVKYVYALMIVERLNKL